MNRMTAAALATTAIIGLTAGAVTAVIRGDAGQGATPGAGSSKTPTPTDSPTAEPVEPTRAKVLYAGAGTIVDGEQRVRIDIPLETPDRLVRVDGGWVVSHPLSEQEPSFAVYHVDTEGTSTKVAEVLGEFDVNPDGDRIVAQGLGDARVTTWDLTGKVTGTSDLAFEGTAHSVWIPNDRVLISYAGEDVWRTAEFTPETGTTKELELVGMPDLTASADGRLVNGSVGTEGFALPQDNYCTAVQPAPDSDATVGWDTCDWRPAGRRTTFSPSGERFLAVTSESDGFGPGEFVAFSATQGPRGGITPMATPDLTLDGSWLDEDRLALMGASDADLDEQTRYWVSTCELETQKCTEVVREPHRIVLGEQA